LVQQVRLWAIGAAGELLVIPQFPLDSEERLEEWLAGDIGIIGDDLLIIGRQVATDFDGYIDLLAIGSEGDLVVIELKRGKTPREITAQALDYASWAAELSHEKVERIANEYLREKGPLAEAFRTKFGEELPEVVNNDHRIVVVGSAIDPASERIIEYLSERHGVNINAVTFQFMRDDQGGEYLSRVFLLEPAQVQHKADSRGNGTRRRKLTTAQLEELAETNGVGGLYRAAIDRLGPLFEATGRTASSFALRASAGESMKTMLSFIPGQSSATEGLAYQAYTLRLASRLDAAEDAIRQGLPSGSQEWKYSASAEPDWWGMQGFFQSEQDLERLAAVFEKGTAPSRGT